MIADISPARLVVGSVVGTAVAGGLSGEHVQVISLVSGAIAAIILAFAWLDARTDKKIRTQAELDREYTDLKLDTLLKEIRMLIAENRATEAERRAERATG